MVLSDRDIRRQIVQGRIVIDPYDDDAVQPASVDLCLGSPLLVEDRARIEARGQSSFIDPRESNNDMWLSREIDEHIVYELQPGEFALGITAENVEIPDDIVGRLDGKSSLGRLGLVVHSTAGFVDPGWKGRLTLELSNLSSIAIKLSLGMKISQISFVWLSSPAERPYGSEGLNSKYQGQMQPVPSLFHLNYVADSIDDTRKETLNRNVNPELRAWYQASEFRGNVGKLATELEVNQKTVEDWVYGRFRPSIRHYPALYRLTGLSEYATGLLLPEDA